MKTIYKQASCCGHPDQSSQSLVVPLPDKKLATTNICVGKKPSDSYWDNRNCSGTGLEGVLEQAGANVTMGYKGEIEAMLPSGYNGTKGNRTPILTSYLQAGLCPVNVHWHLGTEHLSVGEFDEQGTGPAKSYVVSDDTGAGDSRRLAANARLGFRCNKFNANDVKFTTEYNWQHCKSMHVGETYEVHWPHSVSGACGTPYQYQTPFYDGVFCMHPENKIISLDPLNTFMKIGVQSQVFTIVNDDNYYYPDLMRGMIVDGMYGQDIGKYTGSTTGTSRSNVVCSRFTPITWQVDRKCHLISASSFDKMCADMKTQADDMSDDLHPHGSRELVADKLAANNLHRRLGGSDSDTKFAEHV